MNMVNVAPVNNIMPDVIDSMLQALRDGANIRTVARKHFTTYDFVRRLALKNGITLRRGNPNFPLPLSTGIAERQKLIIEELKKNNNMAEVARIFGISRERVRQLAVREKIYPNRTREEERLDNVNLLRDIITFVDSGLCTRCDSPAMMSTRQLTLCEKCHERRRLTGIVISRLRTYLKTGNRRSLTQVAWTVREYGITMEDIRSY